MIRLVTAWVAIEYGVPRGADLGGSPGGVELGVDASDDVLEANLLLLVKC